MTETAGSQRLFVALGLPEEAVSALAAFAARAADPSLWRVLPETSLHLTLAFLGWRPAADVEPISSVLAASARSAPRLVLGGALMLPPRRPRTLGAALAEPGGAELAALQARVSAGLAGLAVYTPETRPFRPHVTVARLRTGARAPRIAPGDGPEPVAFDAAELLLMRSQLKPGGAAYSVVTRVTLA